MLALKKIKSSRLLVQRINEFEMNEIQRKTPKQNLKPSWQTVIVIFGLELTSYIQATDDSKRTDSPAKHSALSELSH